MFGFTYKLTTVNADKNIVKLTPTLSTYLKAFAPSFVIWGLFALFFAASSVQERRENNRNEEDITLD